MMLVDSHVNLHSEKFAEDFDEVLERAVAAGVRYMLTISDRIASIGAVAAVAARHAFVARTVGVHPHYVKDEADLTADAILRLCDDPEVAGVGECGLDFHYEYSPRDLQERIFRAHVAAARASGLPLVIHTRDADARMQAILEEEWERGPFTPLLHCYTGGDALADAVIGMGGYVSFSGIITFRNAEDIRAIARRLPLERVIIETDCPYLAPVPMRGRRCEPAHLVHVAAKLAEIRGLPVADIAAATTDNFFRLFSRCRREDAA